MKFKYSFHINQAGVVHHGLLGRATLGGLCFLDYLQGWSDCRKAKRIVRDHREYVWLQYEHAVEELPMLFNPEATVATGKNQLVKLVRNLRDAGLVATTKQGRDLYFALTPLAVAVAGHREQTATKSAPVHSEIHDDTVTPSSDGPGTPLYIVQQDTKEESPLVRTPPAGSSEPHTHTGAFPDAPNESEVKTLCDGWPGDPALGIPPQIPEIWWRRWYAWKLGKSRFPARWREVLEHRFKADWVAGILEARGISRHALPAKESPTARRIRLENQLKHLRSEQQECARDPDPSAPDCRTRDELQRSLELSRRIKSIEKELYS